MVTERGELEDAEASRTVGFVIGRGLIGLELDSVLTESFRYVLEKAGENLKNLLSPESAQSFHRTVQRCGTKRLPGAPAALLPSQQLLSRTSAAMPAG